MGVSAGNKALRIAITLTLCALCFSASPSFAQTAPAAAAAKPSATTAYRAPRTPDGRPNLSGIWQALNSADWDLQGHAAGKGPMPSLGAWTLDS